MIGLEAAIKEAESVYDDTKVIRAFELDDSYVFAIDYVDAIRRTPGMPLIRVFKETGEVEAVSDRSEILKGNKYNVVKETRLLE